MVTFFFVKPFIPCFQGKPVTAWATMLVLFYCYYFSPLLKYWLTGWKERNYLQIEECQLTIHPFFSFSEKKKNTFWGRTKKSRSTFKFESGVLSQPAQLSLLSFDCVAWGENRIFLMIGPRSIIHAWVRVWIKPRNSYVCYVGEEKRWMSLKMSAVFASSKSRMKFPCGGF